MVDEQLPLPIRFNIGPGEADGSRREGTPFRFALDRVRPPDDAGVADHPVVRVLGDYSKGLHRLQQPLIPLPAGRFAIDRGGGGGAERNNLLVLLRHEGFQVMCVERANLCFEGGFEVCRLISPDQHGSNTQSDETQ